MQWYSRIKYIRLMINNTSRYRLVDVKRTPRVFTNIVVLKTKVARNLRTNLNVFTE